LLLSPLNGEATEGLGDSALGISPYLVCPAANSFGENGAEIDRQLQAATRSVDNERAAALSVMQLCQSIADKSQQATQLQFAATAAERLLDADQPELADSIIERWSERINSPPNDEGASRLLFKMAIARSLSYHDRNLEALELRDNLRESVARIFGEFSSAAISNRLRIANLKVEVGQISSGSRELDALLKISQETNFDDQELKPLILRSHALAMAEAGEERDATNELRKLRAELVSRYGTQDHRVMDVDEDISSVLIRSEEIEEALTIESNVLLWEADRFSPNHPRMLRTLWQIAYLCIVNQRVETAESVLSFIQSQLTSRKTYASGQMFLQTMSRIANVYSSEGHFQAAAEIWGKVYDADLQILGTGAADTQIEASNYAAALYQLGKTDLACPMLRKTLDLQQSARPRDVWSIEFTRISFCRCLLDSGDPHLIKYARDSLDATVGEILGHTGKISPHALLAIATFSKAARMSGDRKGAKELLELLVKKTEEFRSAQTTGTPVHESALLTWVAGRTVSGDQIPGYRDLALMHAEDAELESALRISELARDRALGDLFAEQEWRQTKLPTAERARLDALSERVQGLEERIAVTGEIVERIRLESERTLLVAERGRIERELGARLRIADPSVRPPTLDDLRARMNADTALISVLHSGDAWWALVITRDAPARFVDFHDADLGRNALAWVRMLRGDAVRAWPIAGDRLALGLARPPDAIGAFLTQDDLAQRLGRSLLEPLVAAAGPARHLVFVGDDELVGVPLQALPLAGGLALDRLEITYAPSLSTFARWQRPSPAKRPPRDLLAIGAIDYPSVGQPATDDPIVIGMQYAGDHPLPFAREEIDAIAARFPAARRTTWSGRQATKASLREASRTGALAQYRYVHLATHAWAQPDQPESSAIALAGAPEDLPTARALTAAELAGLHMGADLLVLSACDTGLGHFEQGRGLLGLAYASLAAGNRAALLSLWAVADDTTAQFMEQLYARLRSGVGPAAALAATQRAFRRSTDPRRSDPLVWAPFVLYGGY
jgi:tetratricopeptide (TPR) repeat protein